MQGRQSSDKNRDHKSGGASTYVDSEDYHRYSNSSNNSSPYKQKQQQQSGRGVLHEEEDLIQNEYTYPIEEPPKK